MSMMSTLAVPVQLVAVIIAAEPIVELCTNKRFVIELPIMAKVVQVKVVPGVKVTESVFVAVPVRVNVAIPVGLPETVWAVPVRLKDAPFQLAEPNAHAPVPLMLIVAVLAETAKVASELHPFELIVLEPRFQLIVDTA
jgi:hypothetical protein